MSGLNEQQNAIEILRTEHEQMRDMIKVIESTDEQELKSKTLQELLNAAKIHAHLEERLFYPYIVEHIRLEHVLRPAEDFNSVEVLLSDIESARSEGDKATLTKVAERLEKHIFDAEELLFLRIEQRCSDVSLTLADLSDKMLTTKKELTSEYK